MKQKITLRKATESDLDAINQVIIAAVMSWQLPDRVKRLSLSSYYYDVADLMHLTLWLAQDKKNKAVGVAGWEPADPTDLPKNRNGLLLHGLYVLPGMHGHGLGKRLLKLMEQQAAERRYDGVMVKAQADAINFFLHHGYEDLPVEDKVRHYSHRMWKNIKQ